MNISWVGNLLEALLWFGVAASLLIATVLSSSRRRIKLCASVAFAVFGVSDLVEMQTGSWWKPPWLLVLKCACIAVFATCLWLYLKGGSEIGADQER